MVCYRSQIARKRGLTLLTTAVLIAALFSCSDSFAARQEDVVDRPRLYWRNGDHIDGKIVSATDKAVAWQTDVFTGPLAVHFEHLHMVRFPPKSELLESQDQLNHQVIETHDGNRFFGQVTDSDEGFLNVETDLFGEIRVDRSAVSLIANPIERAHVYSGPKGLRGWSTLTYGRKLSEWDEIASGRLMTRMVAAELYRQLPARGSVDIDIELLWRNNPSFQIRFLTPFAKPSKETIKVETRSSGYVLQTLGSNGRFRQLDVIPKDALKCRLQLRWHHAAGELSVLRDRKYLGKIAVKRQSEPGNAGIYIKNTGPQLTISRLEVRASSSLDMTQADTAQDTILQANNKSLTGTVGRIEPLGVELNSDGEAKNLKWSEIAEVAFRKADVPAPTDRLNAECVFQNGETLKGNIVSATESTVTLRVPAIDRPLVCKLAVLERIVLGSRTVPEVDGSAYLEIADKRLHGTLAAASSNAIGWLPIGGVEPVVLEPNAKWKVFLQAVESSTVGGPQDDLIYLRNGDVFPCQLVRATPEKILVQSELVSKQQIEATDVHAVELSVKAVAPLEGFDEGWNEQKPAEDDANRRAGKRAPPTIQKDAIRFRGPATVRRAGVLYGCDHISFELQHRVSKGGVFLHLGLLGDEGVEDRAIPFYFMDEKLFVLGSKRNAFVPTSTEAGIYKVAIETHDPFRVVVNGKTVYSIPRDENGGPWSGLSFDVSDGPLFGPPLRTKSKEIDISIRNFRVSQTKRASIRQSTGAIDSDPLLTIPRNREADQLTHLAIGGNSDVVRGNLVELADSNLHLRSKAADVHLTRTSVAGLIWLHEATADTPVTEEPPQEINRIVLKDTTTITLLRPSMDDEFVFGEHPTMGHCRLAVADIQSILSESVVSKHHQHPFLSWHTRRAKEPDFATDGSDGHKMRSKLVGQPIKFEAKMLETRARLDLQKYRGKVVVLDFWASWCAPCVRNMPKLIETVASFADEDVQLIGVNQGEDVETVTAIVESKQWDLTVATDLDGSATQEMRIEALPQTVILDQQGNVAAVFIGASSRLHQELKAEIRSLLGE